MHSPDAWTSAQYTRSAMRLVTDLVVRRRSAAAVAAFAREQLHLVKLDPTTILRWARHQKDRASAERHLADMLTVFSGQIALDALYDRGLCQLVATDPITGSQLDSELLDHAADIQVESLNLNRDPPPYCSKPMSQACAPPRLPPPPSDSPPTMNLHPALSTALGDSGLDPSRLHVLFRFPDGGTHAREELFLTAGGSPIIWRVPSLRALLRGSRLPPSLAEYPPEYVPSLAVIELHLLDYARTIHAPLDGDVEEVYGVLRRRPDGKSLGPLHDSLWQAAALMLGLHPTSQAEFDAILSRLAGSARRLKTAPGSRSYVAFLEEMFTKR